MYVSPPSESFDRYQVWLDDSITEYAETEGEAADLSFSQAEIDKLAQEMFEFLSEDVRNALVISALRGPGGPPGPAGPPGMAAR
jgi:hypothetical protein